MSEAADIPVSRVEWKGAVRIIRSAFPPNDLFEDIADPADWPLLISAEQKTNPRIMATIGNIDLVPAGRRVGGSGTSYLMAPFTHVSTDRPSRFTDGSYGVLPVPLLPDEKPGLEPVTDDAVCQVLPAGFAAHCRPCNSRIQDGP